MPSHAITGAFSNGGTAITSSVTKTVEAEHNFDVTVPGNGNVVIDIDIDVSALSTLWILSTGAVTLTTNDDGTPDDTLVLAANEKLEWTSTCGLPNPFASTVDVTSIKATKGTATDATLKIRVGIGDATT